MSKIKSFDQFINEDVEFAQPAVKPTTKPKVTPTTKPGRPSPYRKDRPSTIPGPKASAEQVADKFLKLTEGNREIQSILNKKYNK